MTQTQWQPIETAPKDGTPVLLGGGSTDEEGHLVGSITRRPVVAVWCEDREGGHWAYAHWDSAWRSAYENPSRWMPLPSDPEPRP